MRVAALDLAGTSLVTDASRARLLRVAGCRACGRAVEVRDPAKLWELGWHSHRDTSKESWPRLWWCPGCAPQSSPPSSSPAPRALLLPAVAYRRAHAKARRKLERDLRHFAQSDRAWVVVLVTAIIDGARHKTAGRQWRAFLSTIAEPTS